MSYAYEMDGPLLAARASQSERAAFIRRTYLHLAGAILAFVALEAAFFLLIPAERMTNLMVTMFASPISALVLLAAFIGVGMLARWWAYNGTSPGMAYAGLAFYVVMEAIIFLPLLYIAIRLLGDPSIVAQAGILTLGVFGGLTLAAFTTRKDFSFLGPILYVAAFVMLGVCVCAIIFGFNLGLFYSFVGVALACGFILYDTSNVIHHFRTDMHVAAALELFASVAYLFYHILRILIIMAADRR